LRYFDKIEIPSIGSFRVTKTQTRQTGDVVANRARTELEVDVLLPGDLSGVAAKLFDDDDHYLQNDPVYPSLLNLPLPLPIGQTHLGNIVPLLQSAFRPSYIEVTNANAMGWNITATVPFIRNVPAIQTFPGVITSHFDQGNLDLKGKDRPEFWAHSVAYGYQPAGSDDGDPDSESALEGGTPKWRLLDPHPTHQALGYSVLFMEAVRDVAIGRVPSGTFTNSNQITIDGLRLIYWSRLAGQTAHEVGHAPGRQSELNDHFEQGLMKSGGEFYPGAGAHVLQMFSPATIRRFRATTQWND
jgi:hypothetical protein